MSLLRHEHLMKKNRFIYYYLPAITWSAFIFLISFIPGNELPKEDWLDKIHFDKIVHAVLYCILFLLTIRIDFQHSFYALILVASVCCIQGIIIEYLQGSSFVSGRSFDSWDIAANLLGIAAGILLFIRKHKTN